MYYSEQEGITDVASFNTLTKAHLQLGNFVKAQGLFEEMKKESLQPKPVTYHELINDMVLQGDARIAQRFGAL